MMKARQKIGLKDCNLEYIYKLNIDCPVCQKSDWCSVYTYDSEIYAALCQRVDSNHQTPQGGHIHFLKDLPQEPHMRHTFEPQQENVRASPALLDDVYRRLLMNLSLSSTHLKNLTERGLTAKEAMSLGYKSLPENTTRATIVHELEEPYGSRLLSVPGFYLTRRRQIWLAGKPGMLIPCRNVQGQIIGAQIRVDTTEGNGKYRWLSTTKKQRKRGGVGSGTPLHVAERESDSTRVWITEGVLKADIAAKKLGETVIGIAGVGAYNPREMQNTLLTLNPREVVVAFDADFRQNPNVNRQMKRLSALIMKLKIKVSLATWEAEKGKGIDDLLLAGHVPTIEPFKPAPNLDSLKASPFLSGEKRVRRIKNHKRLAPTTSEPVDIPALREMMRQRILTFAQFEEAFGAFGAADALLIRATQGLGKSTNSIEIVDSLWREGFLRPIYAAPRHDLILGFLSQMEERGLSPDWLHLRPRKPREEKTQKLSPQLGYLHLRDSLNQQSFSFEDLDLLCHHWKKADQLGNKRWNVPKNLCVQSCEIGTGLMSTNGCPYFQQYHMPKPLATVHETLFIPKFCSDIFNNQVLELKGVHKQVVIIDEPNPSKFIDTVDITVADLSKAIIEAWDDGLVDLLALLREVAESVARSEEKQQFIAREAMDLIVKKAGGAEKFAEILQKARAEYPRTHETVIVKIDALLDLLPRSLKVRINGHEHYLPKQVTDVIDNRSVQVAKWYALKEDLPIAGEIQTKDNEAIPLNFTTDLLTVLRTDFRKWSNGEIYNSPLVITPKASTPAIRLNLRRELHVPRDIPIILLDGCGNPELLSKLLRRKIQTWSTPIPPNTEIIQVVDGGYGVTTLWNKPAKKPKPSFWRLWNKVICPFAQKHPEKTLIVTWKCVADYLRNLQEMGKISSQLAIEHYGNTEGSNAYEDRVFNFLLGTPQPNSQSVIEATHALFLDEDPINPEMVDTWKAYNYTDCDGNGYEACVKVYLDPRCEMLAHIHREDELVQAAHRIRPLLHEGKMIYLLTHLPVDDLPPTRLVTIDELGCESGKVSAPTKNGKVTKAFAQEVAREIFYEAGSITQKAFKVALEQTFRSSTIEDINSENDERQSEPALPSDSTLERWLKDLAMEEGWDRSRVTIERRNVQKGGGATWVWVYHCGEIDEFTVRAHYRKEMEIDMDDDVIVEGCPWTEADFQDFSAASEGKEGENKPSPP